MIASENDDVDVMKDSCSACGGQHKRYCQETYEPTVQPVNGIEKKKYHCKACLCLQIPTYITKIESSVPVEMSLKLCYRTDHAGERTVNDGPFEQSLNLAHCSFGNSNEHQGRPMLFVVKKLKITAL